MWTGLNKAGFFIFLRFLAVLDRTVKQRQGMHEEKGTCLRKDPQVRTLLLKVLAQYVGALPTRPWLWQEAVFACFYSLVLLSKPTYHNGKNSPSFNLRLIGPAQDQNGDRGSLGFTGQQFLTFCINFIAWILMKLPASLLPLQFPLSIITP